MAYLYIKTFGCQMNVYDSHRIQDALEALGFITVDQPDEADVMVLNTCHIREKADDKLFSEIGRLNEFKKKRQSEGKSTLLVVVGCVVQASREVILQKAPAIDIALGPQNYHELPRLIVQHARQNGRVLIADFPSDTKFDVLPAMKAHSVSAFVAIQEGCDNFCSYCVVPYTRGCEYSRSFQAVLDEVKGLVDTGAKEIMLLGQNVNCWTDGDKNFGDLLSAVAEIKGVERLRYMTSYPSKMTQNVIDAHRCYKNVMPYVHLPIQSGSDEILQKMNRKYTVEGYLDIIERFRKARPDIAISSDFIVGFPTETEQQFEETVRIAQHVQYASSFSFKFSARPGTPASLMKGQIAEAVKTERLKKLQHVLQESQKSFNKAVVGTEQEILWTSFNAEKGQVMGYTPYMQSVHMKGSADFVGNITSACITSATLSSLTAKEKK